MCDFIIKSEILIQILGKMENVPNDTLIEIFCFSTLPNLFDIMMVSKRWNILANNELVWINKCNDFGIRKEFFKKSFKEVLKEMISYFDNGIFYLLFEKHGKFQSIMVIMNSGPNIRQYNLRLHFENCCKHFDKCVYVVMVHSKVTKEIALDALIKCSGDIVKAVIFLKDEKEIKD